MPLLLSPSHSTPARPQSGLLRAVFAPATHPPVRRHLPVLPGIECRLRDFGKWLRALTNYEDSVGEALHLIGDETTLPDPATLTPAFTLRLNGGKVEILWGWGSAADIAKALYIEVDRGQGPQFLAADTNPNYTDSAPLPAAPAKWKYRAIWQRDGIMLGQWTGWQDINLG